MSLTPDWAPNIHPLVVHFPIALLTTALLVDLVSLFMRHRVAVRDAATWLYCGGAAVAILAYFTGDSAADDMLLPAQVAPLVDVHADWAFRATWFFAFFASARLAVSYILPPRPIVLGVAFAAGCAGVAMLVETAEHGGRLVFQHGLGVQAITADPASLADDAGSTPDTAGVDPGPIILDGGSWVWRPVKGADVVLAERFEWLEGEAAAVTAVIETDQAQGAVLSLEPHGDPVLFVGGSPVAGMQADVRLNLDRFEGQLQLVSHVQTADTFDFFEVSSGSVKLGRVADGVTSVFEEATVETHGWTTLRVYGGDGHFRGYVDGELYTHGHADDLPAGRFGLRLHGRGPVLVERLHVQAVDD